MSQPHLFKVKANGREHEIKLLIDPGANITILSSNLDKKIDMSYQGSVLLEIKTAAGCSTTTKGEIYLLTIPTKERDINISG